MTVLQQLKMTILMKLKRSVSPPYICIYMCYLNYLIVTVVLVILKEHEVL